ncbi:unnamed protein product, partial [Prorocentrum cordatum]
LWLEEAASPLARACPREAARRPSRPPWPARSPSCACWCRRPPRRRSAWRAASVGRSARPAAEPPPLPARNRARPPRGPPAPAGPPPRRSRRARWPARPPRRRGALRRPRRRGPGVCPTRDGGRRLLHAERHRHESQGGRDQGVSRRRALCCSPSTCSRGADMRRQDHALHKCSYNAAGLANRGAVFMYIAGRVRPLWAPYLAGAAPVAACIRATASSARLCAQEARARGSRGAWAAHAFFRAEPAGRHLRRCRCHRRKRACSQSV